MVACYGNTHGNDLDSNDVCIYCMLITSKALNIPKMLRAPWAFLLS